MQKRQSVLSTSIDSIACLKMDDAATNVEKRTLPEILSVFARRALGASSKRRGLMQVCTCSTALSRSSLWMFARIATNDLATVCQAYLEKLRNVVVYVCIKDLTKFQV